MNKFDDLVSVVDDDSKCLIDNINRKCKRSCIISVSIVSIILIFIPLVCIIMSFLGIIDKDLSYAWIFIIIGVIVSIPLILGKLNRAKQKVNDIIEDYFKRIGNEDFLKSDEYIKAREASDSRYLAWLPWLILGAPIIGLGIGLVCAAVGNFIQGNIIGGSVFIVIIIILSIIGIYIYRKSSREIEFKNNDLTNFLKTNFPDISYDYSGAGDTILNSDDLLYFGMVIDSEDLLQGNYNGVNWRYYEITMNYTSRGKNRDLQHFIGGVLCFDYPVFLSSPIVMSFRNKYFSEWNGSLLNSEFAGENELPTGDKDFDKKYAILGNSYNDYSLVRNFISQLFIEVKKWLGNDKFIVGFKDNKVWVCLPKFDLFKASSKKEENNMYLEKAKNDIYIILNIIYNLYQIK